MRVLGLSSGFHDASAALVVDGEVISSAAEERFTRLKHDASFPIHAARFCLDQGGAADFEVDRVVFYEEPWSKFSRVLTETLSDFPRSIGDFTRAGHGWLTDKLWIHNKISKTFDVHPDDVVFVPHHQSHAAQAFCASGFAESAVLTADGVGEWTCTSIVKASRTEGIKVLETYEYPNSIGLVYAAFTAFLGFRPNDSECSTMALAAFGAPSYAEKVRRVMRPEADGSYKVAPEFFNFLGDERRLFRPSFLSLFGDPRDPAETLPFRSTGQALDVTAEHQRYADIAASVQVVLEEVVLGLARRAHQLTGSDRLCLAGGAAMNAVAVGRLLREGPFRHVFVPPDPGDGGAATGAAMAACADAPTGAPSPYLGKAYSSSGFADVIGALEVASHHRLNGCRGWSGRLSSQEIEDVAARADVVAEDLAQGRLVGWVQGRFEQGPRALGNRSILADPGNAQAALRLSRSVKRRAAFRPYALSIAIEDAARLLPGWNQVDEGRTARWMQSVELVDRSYEHLVRQALHCDGTTRPQVCSIDDNPHFHQLLLAFGARTGLAAVLNTSFNESGYPMVASLTDAMVTFLHTDIDVLVLETLVIRKVV